MRAQGGQAQAQGGQAPLVVNPPVYSDDWRRLEAEAQGDARSESELKLAFAL